MSIPRLAFLAAKPQLQRRARPWWVQLIRLLDVGASPGVSRARPGKYDEEIASERMSSYALACDHAAGDLSDSERQALRERGELPPWFLAKVDELAADVRRERR